MLTLGTEAHHQLRLSETLLQKQTLHRGRARSQAVVKPGKVLCPLRYGVGVGGFTQRVFVRQSLPAPRHA